MVKAAAVTAFVFVGLSHAALVAQARGAQSAPAQAAPAKPAATQPAPAQPAPAQQPAAATVPEEPQGYTYDPDGRRDPFVSLLRRGGTGAGVRADSGPRPAGLAGLETSEVTLKGVVQSQTGYVGIVLGADQKTYIVRPGDKLLDGTIGSITQNALVILQQVNDPLSLEKQREVRKVLRQTDEAK